MKTGGLEINLDNTLPQFVETSLNTSAEDKENSEEPGVRTEIKFDVENQDYKLDENLSEVKPEEIDQKKEDPKEGSWVEDTKQRLMKEFGSFLEYLLGFILGLSFSLLGYTFLNYMNKKQKKRKGLFVGCIVSFVVIILTCLLFMSYTRNTLLAERAWRKHHRTLHHLNLPGFSLYLRYSIENTAQNMRGLLSIFSMSENNVNGFAARRKKRTRERTSKKLSALKHLHSKIRRHLRRLL